MTRRTPPTVVVAGLGLLAVVVVLLRSPDAGAPDEHAAGASAPSVAPLPRRHVAAPAAPRDAAAAAVARAPAPAVVGGGPTAARVVPGRTVLLTDLPPREGDLGAVARDLLDEHRGELGLDRMTGELVLERELDSLSGRHVRFVQAVRGVVVFGSRVSSHVSSRGRPLMLRADVYPIAGIADDVASVTPRVTAALAAEAAVELASDDDAAADASRPRVIGEPTLVILPRGREGLLAWHVGVRSPSETLRVFVDAADGAVVRADDARVAAEGRGVVFAPNPVHSSGNGALRDQGDRDQAALTNQLQLVTLPRLDGVGYLVGEWADLRDSPVSTFRADLDWTWVNREHHAFEQVMAYYHVDRVQDRLQALGLSNVNAEPQSVNAHAAAHDQSIYDTLEDRLEFGDGGVDDAEDADVIVHEYGHAMQFDQVGTFGLTGEGGAMGEGFGDFLAALFHESGRPGWDALFGSWDATAIVERDPPYLRRVDREKRFPDDYVGEVHADGEIWSRFLMDLRYLIGADDALRVVVESHFFLTPNARFREGCDALLVANIAVRDGRLDASIRALLQERGLPFLVPDAPLPEEEEFEVDERLTAATLEPGSYPRLLLADDDYVKVVVPPYTRLLVRTEFDPARIDLDAEAFAPDGALAGVSAEAGGVEQIELAAGDAPVAYVVRFHHAAEVVPGAYDLTLTLAPLEAFGPTQTIVRSLDPGATWAFRVSVDPAKVADGARLKVVTRKLRRGAKTDLRLFDPSGVEVVDATAARRKKGGKAVVDADAVGDWLGVVRPRAEQSGPTRLKIKLK